MEAIEGFCSQVWPTVKRTLPSASLHIAGCWPHRRVARLGELASVSVHSNPTDMAAFVAACDIAISPLITCAGFPNKVAEAVQGGVPIVATNEACAGLPRAIAKEIAIASSAEEWAQALAQIWTHRDWSHSEARRLRALLAEHLASSGTIVRSLIGAYQDARDNGARELHTRGALPLMVADRGRAYANGNGAQTFVVTSPLSSMERQR